MLLKPIFYVCQTAKTQYESSLCMFPLRCLTDVCTEARRRIAQSLSRMCGQHRHTRVLCHCAINDSSSSANVKQSF